MKGCADQVLGYLLPPLSLPSPLPSFPQPLPSQWPSPHLWEGPSIPTTLRDSPFQMLAPSLGGQGQPWEASLGVWTGRGRGVKEAAAAVGVPPSPTPPPARLPHPLPLQLPPSGFWGKGSPETWNRWEHRPRPHPGTRSALPLPDAAAQETTEPRDPVLALAPPVC